MIIFALDEYKQLASDLCRLPNLTMGDFTVGEFPDQEFFVSLKSFVSGASCLIIGGTKMTNQECFKLFLLGHTLKKEGAKEVIAVIPYLGYARQDKLEAGKSLAAAWLGQLFAASGVDRVVTLDVHSSLVKELYPIPLLSLEPYKIIALGIKQYLADGFVLVAPDEGALDNCRSFQQELGLTGPIAYFQKKRTGAGVSFSSLHGEVGKKVIIVDDILDTGGTLVGCCQLLQQAGVDEILIVVTHGLFTGKKWQRLWSLGVKKIYCTDSFTKAKELTSDQIVVLPISEIFIDWAIHEKAN